MQKLLYPKSELEFKFSQRTQINHAQGLYIVKRKNPVIHTPIFDREHGCPLTMHSTHT